MLLELDGGGCEGLADAPSRCCGGVVAADHGGNNQATAVITSKTTANCSKLYVSVLSGCWNAVSLVARLAPRFCCPKSYSPLRKLSSPSHPHNHTPKYSSHSTDRTMGSTGPVSDSIPGDLPGTQHTATLSDGRSLSYSICGSKAPDAHTVLFLHPIQGNRWVEGVCCACGCELMGAVHPWTQHWWPKTWPSVPGLGDRGAPNPS